jgi:WD40 repeat protein
MRFGRHTQPVRAVAWVPGTGRVLSGGVGGELWLWDAQTAEGPRRLAGHRATIHCVAVSGDGRRALTGGDDMTVRLWDLEAIREVKPLRKTQDGSGDVEFEAYGVAFVSDRRAVSAGNANIAILWDLATGAEDGRLETGLDEVLCLSLSADGRLLLGGAQGRLILRGAVGDKKGVPYAGHLDDVRAAAFFSDGERFVSAGGGDGQEKGRGDYAVRLWRRENLNPVELRGHEARVNGVAVTPDGRRVLSGDAAGNLRLWDAIAGVEMLRFDKSEGGKSAISCLAISPDGAEAVTGHEDGTVRVWTLPR